MTKEQLKERLNRLLMELKEETDLYPESSYSLYLEQEIFDLEKQMEE